MGRVGIDWIKDRPPTEEDGDHEGYVIMRRNPVTNQGIGIHWSYVKDTPWAHSPFYKAPEKPKPTPRPRRFISISRTIEPNSGTHVLDAIADDGTAWCMRLHMFDEVPSEWLPVTQLPESQP